MGREAFLFVVGDRVEVEIVLCEEGFEGLSGGICDFFQLEFEEEGFLG